ncbi:glutaredoxin domain-containing protein [Salinifilum ghardaiensis]
MNAEHDDSPSAVEFYWRPGCPFCMALRVPLRRSALPVREVNIWKDRGAAQRVRAATGGDETVPTVFVGQHALVNPSFRQVRAAVREHAPRLLDEGEPARGRAFRLFRRRR